METTERRKKLQKCRNCIMLIFKRIFPLNNVVNVNFNDFFVERGRYPSYWTKIVSVMTAVYTTIARFNREFCVYVYMYVYIYIYALGL